MTTIETIKAYTDNDVWNIACGCTKCVGIKWIQTPVGNLANLLDANEVDIRDTKAFTKFCHKLLQATMV